MDSVVTMSSKTTAGWIVVVLAAVFVVVWRRRQRWRRARPWLAKLRAEAASKIEHRVEKDTREKDIREKDIREKERPIETPRPKESSDKKEVKRTKERRKRGKEPKPRTQPVQSSSIITTPSPRLVPLPLSPVMTPLDIPSLVLPPTETPKPKLPAFPPASPLPPNLARKPPPLVRKATPSLTSINTAINTPANNSKPARPTDDIDFPTLDPPKAKRKPSDAGRKRKPSTGPTPESTQIASLKGALEAARLREEEVAEERRAWQKKERELQTQVNQLSHQLHALTIAFATSGGQGFPPYGYGYDPSQPVTPIMQVPGKTEEPHTPIEHIAPARTPSGPYPGMYLPYPHHFPPYMPPQHGPPLTPQHGPPITHPIPMPSPTPPMSPPQAPPYLFSTHPWMHRNASPMRGMSSPGGIPITSPITGIGRHHFYSGSPRRGPRRHGTGTPSTPSVGSVDDTIPLPFTDGFTSRKSSSDDWARDEQSTRDDYVSREYVPPRDDYLPLREDYVPVPPPSSGTKREREETDDDEDSTSDSDDDSVIFEDGSVGESVQLSLRGDGVKAKEVGVVRIQVGEQEVM